MIALRLTAGLRSPLLAANDNDGQRGGFVLGMWTGLFPLDENDRPVLFRTAAGALAHLRSCHAWGRTAVTVYRCTVRPNGQSGRPDYILGRAVAYGDTWRIPAASDASRRLIEKAMADPRAIPTE